MKNIGQPSASAAHGDASEPEAIATIHRAIEFGIDLIDTGLLHSAERTIRATGPR
jgi:aryl-alcohol dehydrogenase-like predicted oxidoreductase